ncbi:MAG TPA: ribosome small subunit-dependent GTPase A [Chloroflexota bacterium]|nr:ribosome small subunit-dependent GTPase A [Chloroflexota bacterium]
MSDPTPGTMLLDGTVREGARGLYRVETDQGILLCDLRGRLRKELLYARSPNLRHKARRSNVKARDPLAAGDRVRVLPLGGGRGVIEEIAARAGGALTREATDGTRSAGQVTSVAGVDQLVAVFAARDPEPHLGLLDRLLVLAEAQALAALVCLNKVDLGVAPELLDRLELYRRLGYPVVLASATGGEGLEELRRRLAGRTSALLGPSGVGKSSLLNALEPGLALRVSAISQATGKGRHTTSGTLVVPLADGGRIADTAGIRALAMGGAAAGRLDRCFREFLPYLGGCFHADCGHRHEPGCAVRAAVEEGALDGRRYASYCRLHDEGVGRAGRGWRELVSSRSLVGEGEFRL